MARPTKYDPKKNQSVIDLMSEGASIVEVAAMLGVNRSTIYEWAETYPEFSNTIKKGFELCQAWWERNGRQNLKNKDFNYTGWYMNMKNRFRDDWQEVNKTINKNENTNHNIEVSEKEAKEIKKALDEEY